MTTMMIKMIKGLSPDAILKLFVKADDIITKCISYMPYSDYHHVRDTYVMRGLVVATIDRIGADHDISVNKDVLIKALSI